MKRARAPTSRSRFRFIARTVRFLRDSTRYTSRAGESVNPLASIIARSFRTVSSPASSLSCFHGARRNIRQCRGVLAKLSVALGRLRFTRSCLASPRLACPAVCVLARNVDTSTCPRRRSARPGSASVLNRTAARELEGRKREESIELRSVRQGKRERERMTET